MKGGQLSFAHNYKLGFSYIPLNDKKLVETPCIKKKKTDPL